MGCAQSSLEAVDSATTSDELANPARLPGTADITQQDQPIQILNTSNTWNTNLQRPIIVPDGLAAASSSDECSRPQRSSNHEMNHQIQGSRNNSRSSLSASADGLGITALVDASVPDSGTQPPGCICSPAQPNGIPTSGPLLGNGPSPSLQPQKIHQLAAVNTIPTPPPARAALPPAASQAGAAQRALLPPLQHPPTLLQQQHEQQQQRLGKPAADVDRQTALIQPVGRLKDQQLVPPSQELGSWPAQQQRQQLQQHQLQPAGPPMDHRMLVLIVWDIENVRCPRGNGPWDSVLTPAKVLGYIKQHFIYEPGRVEYRTVAAVTPKSLSIVQKRYAGFVEQMVPELTLLVASAQEPKRNADVMLKKELYRFVSEHAHIARLYPGQLTVVLLSGDEDFLEPVQVALNSGFAVELMHHDKPSWALRNQQGYARPPLLWADFLKERSGADVVNLPYNGRR